MSEKQLLISDVDPENLNFIQAYTIIKQLVPIVNSKLINGGDFSVELFLLLKLLTTKGYLRL